MWHFKLRGIYFIFTPESILRAFEETIKIWFFGCSGYRFPLGSWGHCVELVQIIMRRVKFYGINVMLTLEAEITIFKKNQWKYGRSGSSRFWFRSGHFEEPLKNIMRHIKIRGINVIFTPDAISSYVRSGFSGYRFRWGHSVEPLEMIMRHIKYRGVYLKLTLEFILNFVK